jgi:hypothetical protein
MCSKKSDRKNRCEKNEIVKIVRKTNGRINEKWKN